MSAKGQVRNSIHTVLSHNMNTLSTDYHYGVMDIGDAGTSFLVVQSRDFTKDLSISSLGLQSLIK